MELEVGSIMTGKVMSITKFGAFVSIAPGKSGLVHISEIANTYVNDVNDFLTVGQEVKVKLIGIDQMGRINLSIKQTLETPAPQTQARRSYPSQNARPAPSASRPRPAPSTLADRFMPDAGGEVPATSGDVALEDKIKRFMQDSESKLSGSRQYSEKRPTRRRGGRNNNYDND